MNHFHFHLGRDKELSSLACLHPIMKSYNILQLPCATHAKQTINRHLGLWQPCSWVNRKQILYAFDFITHASHLNIIRLIWGFSNSSWGGSSILTITNICPIIKLQYLYRQFLPSQTCLFLLGCKERPSFMSTSQLTLSRFGYKKAYYHF
jgi:hypothetical protein